MSASLPIPPDDLLSGVGEGDFWRVGFEMRPIIESIAGLHANDRVLDIGCGLGRVAVPIAQLLGEDGTYDGVDACARYIAWCREALPLDPQRFRFRHLDVRSAMYNPGGTIDAENVTLPWPSEHFTLAIATSLFTHLPAPATERYLREIARTLTRGGRLFATFYLLDEVSLPLIHAGATHPAFATPIEHGLTSDATTPEQATAFELDWLHALVLDCGFAVHAYAQGSWRNAYGPVHQDLVVLRRRGAAGSQPAVREPAD